MFLFNNKQYQKSILKRIKHNIGKSKIMNKSFQLTQLKIYKKLTKLKLSGISSLK